MNLVDLLKKNIVMVPVVASLVVGTFTGVRYIVNLTDSINTSEQQIINLERDLKQAQKNINEINTRLSLVSIILGLSSGLLFFPSQNFQSSLLVGNIMSVDKFSPIITSNLLFISFFVSTIVPLGIITIYSLRNSLR